MKDKEFYINEFLESFRLRMINSSDKNIVIPFKQTEIERGAFPIMDIIPSPRIYIWETSPEKVERANRYNKREFVLSIECFFNPKNYRSLLKTNVAQSIANQFLRQISYVTNNCLFAKNPVIEIENSIYPSFDDSTLVATQTEAKVMYVTEY